MLELELERRVFQSKLGVSSSNQCNLHHFPHTGHLKKYKKGSIFFGHSVGTYSDLNTLRLIYVDAMKWR
jgi:hypothetical protein